MLPAGLRAPLRRELDAAVAEACTRLELGRVEKELRRAWGRAPEKVLDELDGEPLAVTPGAQVHRAVLDGAAVAVKVRRPGLESAVRADLGLIDALALPLARVLPATDPGVLLREVRTRILDELDLEHEASTQRLVARALRRVPGVTVPAVHGALCTPEVLVCDLLGGPTLADPHAAPDDPGALARTLVAVHLGLPRGAGLALADARPNHVVLCADGTIGLLGTGAARTVDRARIDPALDLLAALRDDDPGAFASAASALGALPEDAAEQAYPLVAALLGDLVRGPARLDPGVVAAHLERAGDVVGRLVELAAHVRPDPADVWPLRGLSQLALVLAGLGVTEDWAQLALGAGRAGL
jgi:predicted unusual protein kinase regulating ubiquinone biosynthesis (AarF/ABC1/UbiB family)